DFLGIFDYLPWSILTESEIQAIVNTFFAKLGRPPEDWIVIFRIAGIKPQSAVWSIGNITFFDPTILNYGEGPDLYRQDLFGPVIPKDDEAISGKVLVPANGRRAALQLALQQ